MAELRKRNPPRPKPIKPEGMSDADFILSLQSPSTRSTLQRSDKEQAEWRSRPLPANWLANPDAKSNDESVGMRRLDPREVSHVEAIRRRPKNSLGQSELSATTDDKRNRAISGVLYTPAARVSAKEVKEKAINLVEYVSQPIREEWRPMPWYKALAHWLRGNKIKVD